MPDIVGWLDRLNELSGTAVVLLLFFIWWVTGPRAAGYLRTIHAVVQYVAVGALAIAAYNYWS